MTTDIYSILLAFVLNYIYYVYVSTGILNIYTLNFCKNIAAKRNNIYQIEINIFQNFNTFSIAKIQFNLLF